MKKLFVIFAVASMFVACNKPAEKAAETTDSVAVQVDTTTAQVDTVATQVVDSAKAVK